MRKTAFVAANQTKRDNICSDKLALLLRAQSQVLARQALRACTADAAAAAARQNRTPLQALARF